MSTKKIIFGTGLSSAKDYPTLNEVVSVCLDVGIMAFDTAPSYGTEEILGKILLEQMKMKGITRDNIWVQDKIDGWQMQEKNGEVSSYIYDAMKKMQMEYLDAVLIHWPIPEYFEKTYESLLQLKDKGLIGNVGVCNVRSRHLKKWREGEAPDIVQIERNPINTLSETVEICRDRHIQVQDYSPLCKFCKDIGQSEVLKNIAIKYGKSIGQVVMRWHLDTDAIPIFTTQKCCRVQEYADIFDFFLSNDEIEEINKMNKNYKMYLESVACPGF